jgi:hypothetical protein
VHISNDVHTSGVKGSGEKIITIWERKFGTYEQGGIHRWEGGVHGWVGGWMGGGQEW